MKGSETETSTQKLLHDTFTDWVKTDLPAASNILGPNGAANYATDYAKRFTRDKIKENLKKGMKLPILIFRSLLVIRLVYSIKMLEIM